VMPHSCFTESLMAWELLVGRGRTSPAVRQGRRAVAAVLRLPGGGRRVVLREVVVGEHHGARARVITGAGREGSTEFPETSMPKTMPAGLAARDGRSVRSAAKMQPRAERRVPALLWSGLGRPPSPSFPRTSGSRGSSGSSLDRMIALRAGPPVQRRGPRLLPPRRGTFGGFAPAAPPATARWGCCRGVHRP
jgi:hypothetical protein